jgi:hypothetical protein
MPGRMVQTLKEKVQKRLMKKQAQKKANTSSQK